MPWVYESDTKISLCFFFILWMFCFSLFFCIQKFKSKRNNDGKDCLAMEFPFSSFLSLCFIFLLQLLRFQIYLLSPYLFYCHILIVLPFFLFQISTLSEVFVPYTFFRYALKIFYWIKVITANIYKGYKKFVLYTT